MKIGSILENKDFEKRIAITPEIAKKYISLDLEVSLVENYGLHLGYVDEEYKQLGVNMIKDENIKSYLLFCSLELLFLIILKLCFN